MYIGCEDIGFKRPCRQKSFFQSIAVEFSDSHPTLYVVPGRDKPVLCGPNSTCSIMEKPHAGLDDCLNMLLSCFRKRMSDIQKIQFSVDRLLCYGRNELDFMFK